jgi:hypothetical protein
MHMNFLKWIWAPIARTFSFSSPSPYFFWSFLSWYLRVGGDMIRPFDVQF